MAHLLSHLRQHHLSRKIISAIENGRVFHFDFHPTRKGKIRAVHAGNVVVVTWRQRSQIEKCVLNVRAVSVADDELQAKILNAVLHRASEILRGNERKVGQFFPLVARPQRLQPELSPLACRLSEAVAAATRIIDRREPSGFGTIRVNFQNIRLDLHTIEGGQNPAIYVNGAPIFATASDAYHIAQTITYRLNNTSQQVRHCMPIAA